MTQLTQPSPTLYIDTQRPIFLSIGKQSPSATGYMAGLVCLPLMVVNNKEPVQFIPSPTVQGTHIAARMQRLERDPSRAAALSRARQRLGGALAQTNLAQMGLAALRLAAGLSQHTLAERMGTQQANISRWENGSVDLQASSIRKLAKVLGVAPEIVLSAIQVPETEGNDA